MKCEFQGAAFISYLMNEGGLEGFFDAGCDAVCEDVRVVLEQPGVILVIDEGRFDEDGGHARAAQYGEIRILLDAAVREGRIERADVGDKIFLDADGKFAAGRVNIVAVGFTAASSAGIDMDGEEEIRIPFVGRNDDIGIARGFSHEVVALQHLDLMAVANEIAPADGRNLGCEICLHKSEFFVDGTGIGAATRGVTGIQENVHGIPS